MSDSTHDAFGPERVPREHVRLDPPLVVDPAASVHDVVRPPQLGGSVVYLTLRDGSIEARDVAGGGSLWRQQLGAEIDRERSDDGIVLLAGNQLLTRFGDELVVLDPDSGRVQTRARMPECTLAGAVASAPLLYVIEVGQDLRCACLCWDFTRSEPRWKVPIDGWATAITLSRSTLLLAPDDEACIALDAVNGTRRWRRSLADLGPLQGLREDVQRASIKAPILAIDGGAVFGVAARHVAALEIATGRVLWTQRVDMRVPLGLRADPDGDLYLIDARRFYRLETASGRVKVEAEVEDDLDAADIRMPTEPAVTDGFLYFGDVLSGVIGALDTTHGKLKWTFACHAPIPASFAPVVTQDRMYVVDREGALYVFRPS